MGRRSVVVVGAGVFGAWSAWRLAREGWRVTLVEAYGPANPRASSSDHSRVIRAGYGTQVTYAQWATASLAAWHLLARRSGEPLVVECGALFLGAVGDPHLAATEQTLQSVGVTTERLEPAALAARYPQLSTDGLGPALLEPRGGVIRARRAVGALVALARAQGVTCLTSPVEPPSESGAAPGIRTAAGEILEADQYVFACGPWLPALFPQAVGERIRPTRQEVLFFGVPAGDSRFGVDELPVWIDFAAGIYGIPDFDSCGFKVGIDRHGDPIDPDTADRVVGADAVEMARACLARRFPALASAPLVDSHVCQYENTSSGDFLIDRHPAWANVWIVGGGSGHGFKHGPAVGAHVADLLAGRVGVDPLFALAAKGTGRERSVF